MNLTANGKAEYVLIVEDEVLVAMDVESILNQLGHRVAETANRIDEALEIARASTLDLAILDVNLRSGTSYPVADILRERGVPFIFATGYGSGGVADEYRDEAVLSKPLNALALEHAIAEVFALQHA